MNVQDGAVAIDDVPVAAAIVDRSGVVRRSNHMFRQLCDLGPGAPITDLVADTERADLERLLGDDPHPPGGSKGSKLLRLSTACGTVDTAEITVTLSTDRQTVVVFVAPRRFELGVIDELASRAHDVHGHGVVVGDGTRIVHVSDAAAAIYGRDRAELIGMGSLFGLLEASERERISDLVAAHLADGRPIPDHFETSIERPDGSVVPIEMWVKATIDGSRTRTYALISDATGRRATRERLRYLATHDPLTGLATREVLLEALGVVLGQLRDRPVGASLCFIDLDDFKPINDRFGHAAGDEVLRVVGARLREHVRSSDTAARIGGDEFVVLFADTPADSDHSVMLDRLRDVIGEEIAGDGWSVRIGASIGTVAVDDPDRSPATLLDLADRAMYEVKDAKLR